MPPFTCTVGHLGLELMTFFVKGIDSLAFHAVLSVAMISLREGFQAIAHNYF